MSGPQDWAVQSYCFRGFDDNPTVAEKVKAIGLSRIEVCGKHADFADESTFDKVIADYRDAGVKIISIGVQGFRNDPATEEKFFRFAQQAGAKVMSVDVSPDSVPDSLKTAERLADQYDLTLGIHNHGGRHWLGSSQMLGTIFGQTSPRIGLMLDTAWALDSGEDPLAMVDRFADRLVGLHIKDFVFDRARKPEDVVVGTGNLPLDKLAAKLAELDFDGALILEYEGDVDNPVPALTACVQAMQKEMT